MNPRDVEEQVELITEIMIDELTQTASANMVEYIKLGRAVANLAELVDKESLGRYGFGLPGYSPKRSHEIMQLVLKAIYEAAEVPRR